MRPLIPLATAAAIGVLTAAAQASPLPVPTPPGSSALVTIADMTMTVSNHEGYANLRQQPTSHSQLIEKLDAGTKVTILGKAAGGKWYHVKVGDKEGYIARNLLK